MVGRDLHIPKYRPLNWHRKDYREDYTATKGNKPCHPKGSDCCHHTTMAYHDCPRVRYLLWVTVAVLCIFVLASDEDSCHI